MFCFVLAESDTIINNFRDSMLYFIFLFKKKKFKMSNKNKYKTSFPDEWLSNEVYKKWVKKVTDDKHKAYCKVCMKSFSVSGLGVKALEIHSKRKIHMQKCPSNQQQLQFQLDKSDEPADSSGNKD